MKLHEKYKIRKRLLMKKKKKKKVTNIYKHEIVDTRAKNTICKQVENIKTHFGFFSKINGHTVCGNCDNSLSKIS